MQRLWEKQLITNNPTHFMLQGAYERQGEEIQQRKGEERKQCVDTCFVSSSPAASTSPLSSARAPARPQCQGGLPGALDLHSRVRVEHGFWRSSSTTSSSSSTPSSARSSTASTTSATSAPLTNANARPKPATTSTRLSQRANGRKDRRSREGSENVCRATMEDVPVVHAPETQDVDDLRHVYLFAKFYQSGKDRVKEHIKQWHPPRGAGAVVSLNAILTKMNESPRLHNLANWVGIRRGTHLRLGYSRCSFPNCSSPFQLAGGGAPRPPLGGGAAPYTPAES